MIFGNKSQFAVEAILDSEYKLPNSILGRACCWVDGHPLGDLAESDCILGTIAVHLENCLSNLEKHREERFDGISNEEAFRQIDQNLYVYDEEKMISETEDLGCYDFLTGGCETFDSVKSFAISDSNYVKFMIKKDGVDSLRFARIERSVIYEAINEFIDWHDKQIIANKTAYTTSASRRV